MTDGTPAAAESGRLNAAGILLIATLGIAIFGAHAFLAGAMVTPLGNAFGWGRGEVAFAVTIAVTIHTFTNILYGTLADRYGPRAIILPSVPFFCLGLGLLGLAGPSIWSWYLLYALFALLGAGLTAIVWTMLVVDRFRERRGLALAIALSGTGLMVSVAPTLVLTLESAVGLRGIYPTLAVAAFVVLMPLSWLLVPRKRHTAAVAQAPVLAASERKAIMRSGRFWQLGLAFLLVASCVGTFIVHLQPILTDANLTRAQAAQVGLLIGPALIIGRLMTGFLFDVLPPRLVAGVAFALPGVACILLATLPLDYSVAAGLAILIGLAMGSEVDVVAYLSSRYFGVRHYGFVFGVMLGTYGLSIGIAGWAVGVSHGLVGDYAPILMVLAVCSAAACALTVTLGDPPPVGHEAAAAA